MYLHEAIALHPLPQRIISLVPSITELLADLGLKDQIAGITKFCIHPEHIFRTKPRVGGTKTLNLEKIRELNPDLILANREENVKEQVDALAREFPVWLTDIITLEDALEMILDMGKLTGKENEALSMEKEIRSSFQNLPAVKKLKKAAYLIWKNPYMAAGGDNFINDMMHRAGFENVFRDRKRYPEVSEGELLNSGAEVILLSSEPFPFKEKDAAELNLNLEKIKGEDVSLPRLSLVDGEMFSWYGSRLKMSAFYFRENFGDITDPPSQ